MNEKKLEALVAKLLDQFYARRILTLSTLQLRKALKRKNPYLFRAIGIESASEIVTQILSAYMSSSDEGIFGDAFFEPLAKAVCNGAASPMEGADIAVETDHGYKAIAVKSGPSVFNSQSKKRQNQDFMAIRHRMLKLQKHFDAIVGYCYGTKKTRQVDTRVFRELAGQAFWGELTGDAEFYLKIMDAMKTKPSKHKNAFNSEWIKAVNRFTGDFIKEYCLADGSVDWHKILRMNSGMALRA